MRVNEGGLSVDEPICVRVLVVDDYERWRQHLCAALQEIPGLEVVGEAANGCKR